jgi:hypothetical protein
VRDLLLTGLMDRYAEELPEEPAWEDVLRRARRTRRRLVGMVGVAVAAVLVPSALALSAVAHVFDGTKAPRSVIRGFTRHPGAGVVLPGVLPYAPLRRVDSSTAHGVLEVRSLDGPVYLWAANESSGSGKCWFATWAHDLRYPWTAATAAGCDPAKPSGAMTYSYSWQTPHWSVAVLVGRVYRKASTVTVKYGCGQTRVLPVVEHLFMTTFVWSTRVFSLTARDRRGRVVVRQRVPWRPSPGGPTAPNSALRC